MKAGHWMILVVFVLIAVLLWSNQNCPSCKAKYDAITGAVGAWPGAGPGVPSSRPPSN